LDKLRTTGKKNKKWTPAMPFKLIVKETMGENLILLVVQQ
jgi:hypothetical protein